MTFGSIVAPRQLSNPPYGLKPSAIFRTTYGRMLKGPDNSYRSLPFFPRRIGRPNHTLTKNIFEISLKQNCFLIESPHRLSERARWRTSGLEARPAGSKLK